MRVYAGHSFFFLPHVDVPIQEYKNHFDSFVLHVLLGSSSKNTSVLEP